MSTVTEHSPLEVVLSSHRLPSWWDYSHWAALYGHTAPVPATLVTGALGIGLDQRADLDRWAWVAKVHALDVAPPAEFHACDVIYAEERTGSRESLGELFAAAHDHLRADGRLALVVAPRFSGSASAARGQIALGLGIAPRRDWPDRLDQIARTAPDSHAMLRSPASPDGVFHLQQRYGLTALVEAAEAAGLRLVRFVHPRAYDLSALLDDHPDLLASLPRDTASRLAIAEALQPWLRSHEMIFAPRDAPVARWPGWPAEGGGEVVPRLCAWSELDVHGPQAREFAHMRAAVEFFPSPVPLSEAEHRFVKRLDGKASLADAAFDAGLGESAAIGIAQRLCAAGLLVADTPAGKATPVHGPDGPGRIPFAACPLCESRRIVADRTTDCRAHPLYQSGLPASIVWQTCEDCGHSFTNGYFNEPALELLFSGSHEHQVAGQQAERMREICGRIVLRVADMLGENRGRWLDVGFGSGDLLATAAEFGFDASGIDAREDAVEAFARLGYAVKQTRLEEVEGSACFDVISLADVLEHIPDPGEALTQVARLLRPGGVAFVSSPNRDTLVWRQLDEQSANPYWVEIEHYHNFTRESLERLLASAGLDPLAYAVSERYRTGMELIARSGATHSGSEAR